MSVKLFIPLKVHYGSCYLVHNVKEYKGYLITNKAIFNEEGLYQSMGRLDTSYTKDSVILTLL